MTFVGKRATWQNYMTEKVYQFGTIETRIALLSNNDVIDKPICPRMIDLKSSK